MNLTSARVVRRGIVLALPALCLALMCSADAIAAKRSKSKRPISKLSFDPTAEQVDLFDGMEQGVLEAKAIPKNEKQGNC